MAFPEEQSNDIVQDGLVLQQDGVVERNVMTHCDQNENSAGIRFSKVLEDSPRIINPISVGSDTSVSCQNDDQSITKDERNESEEELPVYSDQGQSIPRSQNMPKRKRQESHKASNWLQNLPTSKFWIMVFMLLIYLSHKGVVGFCGFDSTILDCRVPVGSNADWLVNTVTIVKKGKWQKNDSNLALVETENLKIINNSEAYLSKFYKCEVLPAGDYVRYFPLNAFNQYCCPKLPKGNGRADVEMRYGSYVYYLTTTYYDGRLIRISFAEKVRSDIQGIPDYCNASLPESDSNTGKSRSQMVAPDIIWTVIIFCVVLLLRKIL